MLPAQGWKVHVSAAIESADRASSIAWDYCVSNGIPFKFLRNLNVVLAHNCKYAPRASSGKLVTIYPAVDDDARQLKQVLGELGDLLRGIDGPYILSDLRWRDTPLFVRFGGYTDRFCHDERGRVQRALARPDGMLVPDRRLPVFQVPPWAPVPPFLAAELAGRRVGGDQAGPYAVRRALHFSNGGGVYLAARRADGEEVVLKEARPMAGLDENREDAVARLRRERRALAVLDGTDGVPRALDYFAVGGHEFLVLEHVPGEVLQIWQGRRHPLVISKDPSPGELAGYVSLALRTHAAIAAVVDRLHARGVSFGDLHPGNIIIRPDGSAALVDFELSEVADSAGGERRPGLGAAGFSSRNRTGPDRDRYALAALGLWLFLPLNRLLELSPGKVGEYLDFIARRFPLPAAFIKCLRQELTQVPAGAVASTPQWPRPAGGQPASRPMARQDMAAAIRLSSSPGRADRLFPGGIRLFTEDALGFAHGAAGVLWALSVTGSTVGREHRNWLIDAIRRSPRVRPGFYDGAHGHAYIAHHFGFTDQATSILSESVPALPNAGPVGMYDGLAGIGLNYLHFGQVLAREQYLEHATGIARTLGRALDRTSAGRFVDAPVVVPAQGEAGLMHGWSGPGLLFLRLYEALGQQQWLDWAVRSVHADLSQCVQTKDGSLQVQQPGVRTLSYLETGSGGILLVADQVLGYAEDRAIKAALPRLARACCPELVLQANLFNGRAGLLAALASARQLPASEFGPIIARHLDRLSWHALAYEGHIAFPGDQNLRLSMDLATGTAGVLLAMFVASEGGQAGILPFLARSRREQAARRHEPASHQHPAITAGDVQLGAGGR